MSSEYDLYETNHEASNCIDGNLENVCITKSWHEYPWLAIELAGPMAVKTVIIYNRNKLGHRLDFSKESFIMNQFNLSQILWKASMPWYSWLIY